MEAPANEFMVSCSANGRIIRVVRSPLGDQDLTPGQAMALAAWLAALADPGGEQFQRVLEAVRES
jgi:hypothetical protein